jgi:glycerol uptake facilitator-like aquaporin
MAERNDCRGDRCLLLWYCLFQRSPQYKKLHTYDEVVYPGIAATAAFTLEKENLGFGSLLTIGLAYGIGIALGIICCASTSGGHFNPAITLCFAVWQGFPWRKVPYYIFAQIAGAFFAGLILMAQYREQLDAYRSGSRAAHVPDVFMGGPASIFVTYPQSNQNNQGWLILIEFFVDSFIVCSLSLSSYSTGN